MNQTFNYTAEHVNALKVILARGMESAASVISDVIGRKVEMSVPEVSLVSSEEIASAARHDVEQPSVGVRIGVTGDITGSVMLIFPPLSAYRLVDIMMGYEPGTTSDLSDMGGSALCEVGNLAGSFFLNFLGDVTGLRAMPAPPQLDGHALVAQMLESSVIGDADGTGEGYALVAQTVLTQSLQSIEALFFIVPTHNSLATILGALKAENARGSGVM